eukprot:m.81140 g.81140  ORF g.81140 m.81140 type:complete len:122 (-) comp13355_c0_seq6:123-488(-)
MLGVTSQRPPEGPPTGLDCFRVCSTCEQVALAAGKTARNSFAEQSPLMRLHAMLTAAQTQVNDLLVDYNRLVNTYRTSRTAAVRDQAAQVRRKITEQFERVNEIGCVATMLQTCILYVSKN